MSSSSSTSASRRSVLASFGGLALSHLLTREAQAATHDPAPHHPAKAKRVVQLYMSGAASQIDTFDYKPELIKRNGRKFDPDGKVELFQSDPGPIMASPWNWKQYGDCGKWVSSLVPHLGQQADRIAFLHSMVTKSNVHGPATFMQATGFVLPGYPSMGAWLSYGLGSLTDNLPTFVVLPDARGFPPNGPSNWGAGFLPAQHQATMIRTGRPQPIHDLFPPEKSGFITPQSERATLGALEDLNRQHLAAHPGDSLLEARIRSYAMAARLQLTAPEAMDISQESPAVRALYGVDDPVTQDFGTRCLIARRLLERGVRFVQVWSGADNGFPRRNWDSHENIEKDHGQMAAEMDRPAAALIQDLHAMGLLDDTIVFWTTEFGRMPCSQGSLGRDHNPFAFTSWLAGGGVRGGVSYGASDEWSYKVADKPIYCYDVHATVLHLLGLDHTRLTYRNNGIDRRLTDVHGEVLAPIIG
ncbi:MAG: DUF1501 domain-containing protein [Bryobacteraceae bacterium]|nr:DUF1501 domain-containing protein [Bryobacteraceae bacterium]